MEVKGINGQVEFDGQSIIIKRKGFMARTSVGKGEKRIPLRHLTSVQFKPAGPMVNGFIQFSLGGGSERRPGFGKQTTDAVSDENSVVFRKKQQPEFEQLRDAVEQAMMAAGTATPGQVSAPAPDRLDQLKKLADLHAAGALNDAEFEREKARLLND